MSNLIFKEDTHQYFVGKQELVSASTLVSHFSPIFDESGDITRKCAIKQVKTEQELKEEWKKGSEEACTKGRNLHSQVEYWIKNKQIQEADYKDVVEQLSNFSFSGQLNSERKVFNLDLLVAGTIDITENLGKNIIRLFDLKTNKKLTKRGFFRKGSGYEKMFYPVNHLESSLVNKYTLQLSIYALIEEENGFWIDGAELFYINPKSRIIERHPVPYLKQDVLNMIDHYYGRKVKQKETKIEIDDFGF